MLQIQSPFQQLFDTNGSPLDDGYVYIGTANANPETSPIAIYWDDAGTIPAAQPLRTLNGYIVRSGTPARVYTALEDFSMTVKDKHGRVVFSVLDATSLSNLQNNLAASGGSALVGFLQAGVDAQIRTVQSKLRDVISVKDFGAVGDGVNDDTAAVNQAINYINVIGGGTILFPSGTYVFSSSIASIPDKTVLKGCGKKNTKLMRYHSGDFISSFGGWCGIEDLTIDGQGATYTSGNGIIMSNPISPSSYTLNAEITHFPLACLKFIGNAGSSFRAIFSDFYTLGTVGTQAAIEIGSAAETSATSRHFTNCESKGCTLYNFGGCSDLYVTGGYSNGLIFGVNSSKVMITNMRIGAAAGTTTISGSSHQIQNCVFAAPVILNCSNTLFQCEVPDYNITDNGSGNDWYTKPQFFIPTWTSDGTAPSLGNGLLRGLWSRNGRTVTVSVELSFGSTTSAGTGKWLFSTPPLQDNPFSPVQQCGSGYVTNNLGNAAAIFSVRKNPTTTDNKFELFAPDNTGASRNIGGTFPTSTWGEASYVRFFCTYFVGP